MIGKIHEQHEIPSDHDDRVYLFNLVALLATRVSGTRSAITSPMQRRCGLLIDNTVPGGFICSDRPVVLHSTVPIPNFYSPWFGMPPTEVTVPLSSRIALVGSYEGGNHLLRAGKSQIANLNTRTVTYAEQFVFLSGEEYRLLGANGRIEGRANLLAAIDNAKAKPSEG